MNVPVNAFTWLLAILPIVVLLVMMVAMSVGAVKAAPVGLLVSAVTAILFYKASVLHVALAMFKGFWSSLSILIVVWPAILLYEVVNEAGAFKVFKKNMGSFAKNELLQVLLIGWAFTSFLQGITGFGVPAAVGAPLLIGIGVSPFWAVIITLLGATWGNTFGTLAAAWDALVIQGNIAEDIGLFNLTALWSSIYIWIWNLISGILLCWIYGKKEGIKKGFIAVIVISLIHGGGQLLLSQFNTTLCNFIPTVVAIAAIIVLGRTPWYCDEWRLESSPIMVRGETKTEEMLDYPEDMNLMQAFMPYIVLTIITLVILLVPPVKAALGQLKLGLPVPEMVTGYGFVDDGSAKYSPLAIFTHAGMFLFESAIFGYFYFIAHKWIAADSIHSIWKRTVKKTVPSSISVICFIAMSKVMSGTGQTMVMAQGIANVLGNAYLVLAPVVGVLGSFMTSSNMASNILFGGFQATTAKLLGVSTAQLLAAHTAGGAIGCSMCPGSIILGTTTAGIGGSEGRVLRKVMPLSVAVALMVGVLTYLFAVVL